MNLRIFRLLTQLVLFSPFISLVEAQKFIDIDNFKFPDQGKTGIRIAIFDTTEQKYEGIHYYKMGTTDREPNIGIYTAENTIKIFSDASIIISDKIKNDYIIRTPGTIFYGNQKTEILPPRWTKTSSTFFDARTQDTYTKNIVYDGIKTLSGEEIIKNCLEYKSYQTNNQNFQALYYERATKSGPFEAPVFWSFKKLNEFKHARGGELGYLGELSVEMTMISFGYFTHLTSQNKSNQGIDGVYLSEGIAPEMFLTESKGQSSHIKQNSAEVIFNKGLTEAKIYESIGKMSGAGNSKRNFAPSSDLQEIFQQTSQTITQWIETSPTKIFKLGHRLKSDGYCQYYGGVFNLDAYQKAKNVTLSPASPEKDKIEGTKSHFSKISNDPKEQMKIFLKANPIPGEIALKGTLDYLQIPEDDQKKVFENLNIQWPIDPSKSTRKKLFDKKN